MKKWQKIRFLPMHMSEAPRQFVGNITYITSLNTYEMLLGTILNT